MYTTISTKQHGMNMISIDQLTGHGIYYIAVNSSYLHKSFSSIEDAIIHINTYLPVKNKQY